MKITKVIDKYYPDTKEGKLINIVTTNVQYGILFYKKDKLENFPFLYLRYRICV